MDIQCLEYAFTAVESEILPPSPQGLVQSVNRTKQRGPARMKEDVLQFGFELLKLFSCTRGAPVVPTNV